MDFHTNELFKKGGDMILFLLFSKKYVCSVCRFLSIQLERAVNTKYKTDTIKCTNEAFPRQARDL